MTNLKENRTPGLGCGYKELINKPTTTGTQSTGTNSNSDVLDSVASPVEFGTAMRQRATDELLYTMTHELSWSEVRRVAKRVTPKDLARRVDGVIFEHLTELATEFDQNGDGDNPVSLDELNRAMVADGVMDDENVRRVVLNLATPGAPVNGRYRLGSIIETVLSGALRVQLNSTYRWGDCFTAPLKVLTERASKYKKRLNGIYSRLTAGEMA